MKVAQWKLQSARLRCPHCGKTVWMTFKGRWAIHKMTTPLAEVAQDHAEGNSAKYGCDQ